MQVKEVMSHEVVEISADALLTEALKLLGEHETTVVGVYDEGQLLGTLTEHDIAAWQAMGGRDMATTQVREVMRTRDDSVTEDQEVADVAEWMRKAHLPGVMVVRDNHIIGSLTMADMATRAVSAAAEGPAISSAMPARIFLQPIAAPSILGFFALGAAWWIGGSQMTGWYGNSATPEYIFPFLALFGGLAQFLAGMWAFKARDGLATIIHGMWGTFFLAYGVLFWAVANGSLTLATVNSGYGYWFIPLAAITGSCAIAAFFASRVVSLQQWVLTVASIIAAIALLGDISALIKISGYFFLASSLIAWYVASGLLFEATNRRVILPLGRVKMVTNRMGSVVTRPVEYKFGEPGVRAGQ